MVGRSHRCLRKGTKFKMNMRHLTIMVNINHSCIRKQHQVDSVSECSKIAHGWRLHRRYNEECHVFTRFDTIIYIYMYIYIVFCLNWQYCGASCRPNCIYPLLSLALHSLHLKHTKQMCLLVIEVGKWLETTQYTSTIQESRVFTRSVWFYNIYLDLAVCRLNCTSPVFVFGATHCGSSI